MSTNIINIVVADYHYSGITAGLATGTHSFCSDADDTPGISICNQCYTMIHHHQCLLRQASAS